MGNLAIIPARSGSKRIPGKNIRNFLGKPVIAYSIQAAFESNLFDEIMVSTDDQGIAEIALSFGAKVPFLRSSKNSDDHATLADVMTEVINEYLKAGKEFDSLCCLLPTSPLILSKRIIEGYQKMTTEDFDSVCPVVAYSYPILRSLEIADDGKLKMIWPEFERTRSQDLKPAYHDAGSFVWIKSSALLNEKTLWCKNGGAIILPETEVQDIDSEEEWALAEMKWNFLFKQNRE